MAAYLYSLAFDSCRLGPAHGLLFFFSQRIFFATRAPEVTLNISFMKAPCCIFLARLCCVCETQKSIDSFDVM